MRLDGVLFTGGTVISHPLLDRMFGGCLVPAREPAGALGDYKLVIVDARQPGDDLSEGGVARRALEAGVALLVIAPNEGQMAAITRIAGCGPRTPEQAVLIASDRAGGRCREVRVLGYPILPRWDGNGPQPPRVTVDQDRVLGEFAIAVERAAERGAKLEIPQFPDGLKWFMTRWLKTVSVTYGTSGEEKFGNSGSSISVDYTIWAFQNMMASGTTTDVIAQGTLDLNPGTLASNTDQARAVMSLWFKSHVEPWYGTKALTGGDHIPTDGVDSWDDYFEIPIQYKDPFGNDQIYPFRADVVQAITGWSVQNTSNLSEQGSQWFVNTPISGITFPENRTAAFTLSGYVEPFPSACTNTLAVDEASAWTFDGVITGEVELIGDFSFRAASLYATNCGLLACYDSENEQMEDRAILRFYADIRWE